MSLDKKFTQKMQKQLLAEKKRIEDDLADYTVKQGKTSKTIFPEYGDHNGENASEVMSYNNAVAIKNTLDKALRDVNAALQRIKNGSYGICKYCQQEISQARLEARPTSSACIKCKKKLLGEE